MLTPFQTNCFEGGMLPKGSIIIQVGIYPPPYGGISMRIKRMANLVNKAGAKSCVFSLRQRTIHPGMLSFREYAGILLRNMWPRWRKRLLVHIQHSEIYTFRMRWYLFACMVRLASGKVVVTLGSLRYDLSELSPYNKFWFKHFTKLINRYIAVGPHIADKLIMEGCPKEKLSIIPGFVPPDEEELLNGKGISEDLERFFEEHSPIIAACASGIVFTNGRDLYGLDMCIELTARLRNNYPRLGFIYVIAPGGHRSPDDWDYLRKMRGVSMSLDLETDFFVRVSADLFTPLLKRCNIFVRPTCTDGDANSVREALYLGKPVVASDAVSRPEGCLIFRDGDLDEFFDKVDRVIRDYPQHRKRINELNISLPHRKLLQLYSKILSAQKTNKSFG
jgi:glycosyltransferase involved in cell wall biosynthesis